MFGKSKQINKRETPEEDPVVEDKKEIAKLKEEIKELEKETSDEPEQETTEEVPEEITQEVPEETPEKSNPEKKEEYLQVVKELPLQPMRQHIDEKTGVVTNFITIEEALTRIMGEI